MRNLVIIGNGFDLAHGLETGYSDYLRHIVDCHYKGTKRFNDIFGEHPKVEYGSYPGFIAQCKDGNARPTILNRFFEKILLEEATQNWSDIERLYFNELKNCKDYISVKKLNDEFDVIKNTLNEYLKEEEKKFKRLEAYDFLFNSLNSSETLVLNFNYTNTIKQYLKIYSRINLVHIHGELENDENPMIFGYAATENEISGLLQKDINDYLFNIKKYNYKKTGYDKPLLVQLSKSSFVDVYILGHSCGSSDRLILSQIFSQKSVKSINIFYYEDFYNYKIVDIGIDRIVDGIDNFSNKTDRYPNCVRMPQHDDSLDLVEAFTKKFKERVDIKTKQSQGGGPKLNYK
jgi:hypothetical protein